jgi:sterol desaturase/sphingolipid hydroxylase (fatty acid hydroxylase superfamily)
MGIKYSVANHEMHHRKFTVNFAQYCMWYDYGMKTYADYEGPVADEQSVTAGDVKKAA